MSRKPCKTMVLHHFASIAQLVEHFTRNDNIINLLNGLFKPFIVFYNQILHTILQQLNEHLSDILNVLHPVGSIYMSVDNTNPSTFFGGTWVSWGSGRVPVGVDANDTDFDTVEETGGSKTHTLTESEMPSHLHSVGAHSHGLNSHTHSIPSLTGVAGDAISGKHSHFINNIAYYTGGSTGQISFTSGVGGNFATIDGRDGQHTHNVYTTPSTTGAASGSTENSAAFNTGSAGSGGAHDIMNPYITCYMWKRTA